MSDVIAREPIISATDLGVWFKDSRREDFRSLVLQALSGRLHRSEPFHALDGITFDAFSGEVLGVIGSNGAGKTTLCSVIGRVMRPDSGNLTVQGRVTALLSMGAGFDRNLTGRENVYLNGMILGFSRKEIKSYFHRVEEFAGIGEFIDEPVKNYSKGMKSRLGFSIASMLEPEILVLDETLSAGDLEFGQRARARMKELVETAKAVVLVTHDMETITETCDRAIWIDGGTIRADGSPQEVVDEYTATVPPRRTRRRQRRIMDYNTIETEIGDHKVVKVSNIGVRFSVNKKPFWALNDVTFSVRQGEIVGVIGRNGAGKTTLCRTLSRIYRPDSGKVQVTGMTSALLSMGSGFNNQLNALDNIVVNGLMLGIPKKRMYELQEEILEFSGLREHRHKPIKYFSSGMRSRLAFSIAVALDPSLLIIDEALSAGDLAFKEKASEAMQDMIDRAEAVIIVTHSLSFVSRLCTRAIWLDRGQIKFDGEPDEAIKRYRNQSRGPA